MKATSLLPLLVLAACSPPPAVLAPVSPAPPPAAMIADFERTDAWVAAPASGVQLQLSRERGRTGQALRVDFDFRGGGGWAAFRQEVPLALPENYELSFWLRGDAPVNTLELKLIDRSGENVWWINRPEFQFSGDWRKVTFRKRHVTFAWGPARGGEIRDVAAIEFAITAGTGGKGTVWLDDFTLTPLEPVAPYAGVPAMRASSGADAAAAVDADTLSGWRSAGSDAQWLLLDFERNREYGGVIIDWAAGARAVDYDVEVSQDGRAWETVRRVRGGGRARDYLQLPETESRYLRLVLLRGEAAGYGVRDLRVMPLAWGESRNTLFETLAAASVRGTYPKYFHRVQSYWTVVGANGDDREGLINEEGMLEVDKRAFSIEPFLFHDGRLHSWADAEITQSLEAGYLPVPSAEWQAGTLGLTITAWSTPDSGSATLWARYRVHNRSSTAAAVRLYLALRPFQVNPSWQFLNNPGGASAVRSIERVADTVRVNGTHRVVAVTQAAAFGALTYDQGEIVSWLRRDELPAAQSAVDAAALAAGALRYELEVPAGGMREVYVALPWHAGSRVGPPQAELERTLAAWHEELDRFAVDLPGGDARIGNTLRTALAHVLINRDGAAIQPGSRSYERSWIRDGSLTSAALLKLGHPEEVRSFIRWFAPYQYADGKVPCCVDRRGADPVPENDSHGQLIYLVAEYFRHTGDTALVRTYWPNVERAVAYIDSLRQTRRTAVYASGDSALFFGLVPQSISHEGYSEKPMHSYWDDFFTLTGLEDAAFLAGALREPEAAAFAAMRDEFRSDLHRSIARAMERHGIDYIPGAAELGDFDATSTTVALSPGREQHRLPAAAVHATFERYWRNSEARWSGAAWAAYTPYELRTVGSLIRLGQRERAHALLDWFFTHQRPAAWLQWGEVVTRAAEEPRFIGDMPHGWVASDYVRSALDLFAYEQPADSTLVLAAGVKPAWLDGDGVRVRGLHTHYGPIGYTMQRTGRVVTLRFEETMRVPPGGYVVIPPFSSGLARVQADGRTVAGSMGSIRLTRLPRVLSLHYADLPDDD